MFAPLSKQACRVGALLVAALSSTAVYIGCSDASAPPDPLSSGPDAAEDQAIAPPAVEAGDAGGLDADAAFEASFDCTQEAGSGAPHDLRCTGLYTDWDSKTVPVEINRPYEPGIQLWSDSAGKSRWLYVPMGSKIDTSNMDEWVFPVGTKAWKEFRVGNKRVETRLFWKRGTTEWVRTTYRWSDDESRAVRLDDGELNVNGTTYQIPEQGECDQCHQGRKDRLLGVDAVGLGVMGATGITLASLAAEGSLTTPPAKTTITLPEDGSGKAGTALGYLHMNCGVTCHNRNPEAVSQHTGLFMRLSATQLLDPDAGVAVPVDTDTWLTAVNVAAKSPPYPAMGLYRIYGGDLARSLVVTLPETRTNPPTNGQMPPIVTHQVDTVGVLYLKTWMLTLPAPADAGDGG